MLKLMTLNSFLYILMEQKIHFYTSLIPPEDGQLKPSSRAKFPHFLGGGEYIYVEMSLGKLNEILRSLKISRGGGTFQKVERNT